MPTITETGGAKRPRRGLPLVAVAAALTGWLGITALTALVVQPDTVLAFGDPSRLATAEGGALVAAGRGYLVTRPAAPGAVRRLYAGGAWLVLPAPAGGCLPSR